MQQFYPLYNKETPEVDITDPCGNTRDRGIHSQRASDAYFYVMTSYWLTGITQSWCACSVLLLRLSFILFLQFYMYSCVACTVLIPKVTKVGDNKTKTTILPYDILYRLVKGCGISIASTLAYYRLALSHGQSSFDSKCMAISHSTVNYRYTSSTTHGELHYSDVIMSAMASQITGFSFVCSTILSGADQRTHQSSASLAFVRGIHRWPVNSPHKEPVTRKMFPFADVIMMGTRGSGLCKDKHLLVFHELPALSDWSEMVVNADDFVCFHRIVQLGQVHL